MESEAETAQAALKTMRKWNWLEYDFHGMPVPTSLDLSLVVNRLAMVGLPRPQSVVLTLLCQGDMLSSGDYNWRKYQSGSHFNLEDVNSNLSQRQWITLKNLIFDKERMLEELEWHSDTIDLDRLELKKCDVFQWEFNQNRFTIAVCPPDVAPFDPDYFEEWFSAWDIVVRLRSLQEPDSDVQPVSADQNKTMDSPVSSKRGRPVAYDWLEATNSIWAKLYGNELKPQTQADIEKALMQHLRRGDIEPGESTVRPFAKAIWEKFQEH